VDGDDIVQIAVDERVQAELKREIAEINARFAPIAQVKRFCVLSRELSQQEGEITASLKIKRGLVQERYAEHIDRLYGDRPGPVDVGLERKRSSDSAQPAASSPA
jgi:long-chain acyl-CoA synthetase